MELQSRVKEMKDNGLGLAVISYDSPAILSAFSKQHGIAFPMLSDVGSETIKRYGILNTVAMELTGPNATDPALAEDIKTYVSVVAPNPRLAGIAFPGTFILDRSGRVKSRFFEDFYITRNTASSILARTGTGDPIAGTKVSTEHLDITAYPSDAAIAPGNRFSLVLDLKPGPGIHVYAPGAKGYRAVALRIDSQPNVRVLPIQFPASEIYFFKPLNERVPVFQKPFTLVQEVVVEGTPQAQAAWREKENVTFTGTLDYQACDDKQCFNPVSIPLSWTVKLKPLLRERPNAKQ